MYWLLIFVTVAAMGAGVGGGDEASGGAGGTAGCGAVTMMVPVGVSSSQVEPKSAVVSHQRLCQRLLKRPPDACASCVGESVWVMSSMMSSSVWAVVYAVRARVERAVYASVRETDSTEETAAEKSCFSPSISIGCT